MFFLQLHSVKLSGRAVEESLFDLSRKPRHFKSPLLAIFPSRLPYHR
jgi:hypothetical protein